MADEYTRCSTGLEARTMSHAGGGNIKALSSSLGASEEVHGTFFTR